MFKKLFYALLAATLIISYSCSKDSSSSNNTASGAYHPLTANSFWKYKDSADASERTLTATNQKQTLNGRQYTLLIDSFSGGKDTILAAVQGHDYYYNINSAGSNTNGITVNVLLHYLNDTASVGTSWQDNAGTAGGFPATVKTTVIEKGISVSVNGKTFSDVYHTRLDVSTTILGSSTNVGHYEFYIAKGVGVVRIRSVIGGGVLGPSTNTDTELTDYSIK